MSVFKCKCCGSNLSINGDEKIVVCEACDSRQTISRCREEITKNLFNRACDLRLLCDFDRAKALYEKIVAENNDDAEAYWGIILCKYGIEYVQDPHTKRRIPTCHRASLNSVLTDTDYLSVQKYADPEQLPLYEKDAKTIDRLQAEILHISQGEQPFDVFICYKETDDASGKRTEDSVIANDIYHQLTTEGYRVFYAAITLEDKLGAAYEPYIYAALNSAKVMLVIGTKPEYFKAPWVRNEWGRYLKIISSDRSKMLIPCYRDINPYDMPDEFSHLQAQDISKLGFMQDILRGIKKIINHSAAPAIPGSVAPLLKRAYIFLSDEDFEQADEYCERVLDLDPECGDAYLCKMLAEFGVSSITKEVFSHFECFLSDYADNRHFQKAAQFGGAKVQDFYKTIDDVISTRYAEACQAFDAQKWQSAMKLFSPCLHIKDAADKMNICQQNIARIEEEKRLEQALINAIKRREAERIEEERRREAERIAEERRLKAERILEKARLEKKRKAEEERREVERKAKRSLRLSIYPLTIVKIIIILLLIVVFPAANLSDLDDLDKDRYFSSLQYLHFSESMTTFWACAILYPFDYLAFHRTKNNDLIKKKARKIFIIRTILFLLTFVVCVASCTACNEFERLRGLHAEGRI